MSLWKYLNGKAFFFLMFFLTMAFTSLLMSILKVNNYAITFINICYILSIITGFSYDFYRKRKFYKGVSIREDNLDKKYLLSEMLEHPEFFEGDFLCDVLKETSKSMNDEIAKYRLSTQDYREYIETWVHEIKTPIASAALIYENNKNEVTQSMNYELTKIESYVEQALFYTRSNSVEKDYAIKKCNLHTLVNTAIKKQAQSLILNKVSVEIKDLDCTVFTDSKWADFILGQIITNAVKYKRDHAKLSITAEKNSNSITLYIVDNGVGISQQDIGRVFEKGFTGENGRKYSRSTGIGLYLCKKLCDKLGLGIRIESKLNVGTTVKITFPISEMYIAISASEKFVEQENDNER